ncbi:MAG: hypothetical protein HOG05_00505 [Bacteroidetes bacterium]|jgi:hypothetical protein|nr:hypothetical protein [Bacteroidota bacterium]
MKCIPNVTLVSVATTEVEATSKALEYSTNSLKFDRVLLVSHFDPNPDSDIYEYIQIEPFENVGEWGKFIVFDLYKFIDTDFIILVHADGFIVNHEKWDNEFLKYDYIGAPWPIPKDNFSYRDYYGNIIRAGNSVSIRSSKLLRMPSEIGLDWNNMPHEFFHEDGFIAVHNRHILQDEGIKFAPLSIAVRFSREKPIFENSGVDPFVFHKWEGENGKYPCFGEQKTFLYKVIRFFKKIGRKYG